MPPVPVEPPYNEKELLLQTAGGDESAFRRLFERYADSIYGVAFAYTKSAEVAEELLQDVFLKIWLQREKLPSVEQFNNYLFILARNHILNYLRTAKKDRLFREQLLKHFNDTDSANPEMDLLFKESGELVIRAVKELPAQQQKVYELRRDKGLPLEDVAREMGISRNTARNHLNQALKNMRTFLEMHSDGAILLICLMLLLH